MAGTGGGAIIGATGMGAAARGNPRGTDSRTRAGEIGSLFCPQLSGWNNSSRLYPSGSESLLITPAGLLM